jgi:hypothetical protein
VERRSIEAVIGALNEEGVRYLVAGGLAVVAHGYVRFTADLDLVVDLAEENLRRAVTALSRLGYRPRAPVELESFVDPETRSGWVREKGMKVFSLVSDEHAATEIDIFAETPLDFEEAYSSAVRMEVAPGVTATFLRMSDLIAMKERAGRPQDRQDIERLRGLSEDRNDG